ncbi:MAG TPA: CPBP family glutamic-type intramembrane protease [Pyrinomonadaceae bacterium]|jgi:membrane protease YdiL (CAAX protease family)|nr:CPBP family glutamic-type intramembrane protease [Pyrinomonadaceae bacterium]
MSTPTPYLDCVLLAATVYPAGFSYSLHAAWRGAARAVSTSFLLFLALPFVTVAPAALVARPDTFALRGTTASLLCLAALAAPVAMGVEYVIGALAAYEPGGRLLRGVTTQAFWRGRLSPAGYSCLAVVVVGEEFFFRAVWLGTLRGPLGLPAALALAISSLAYGLNHLAFGRTAVASKTAAGLVYGGLYLLGGGSLYLPVVAHELQNVILFRLAREHHA